MFAMRLSKISDYQPFIVTDIFDSEDESKWNRWRIAKKSSFGEQKYFHKYHSI